MDHQQLAYNTAKFGIVEIAGIVHKLVGCSSEFQILLSDDAPGSLFWSANRGMRTLPGPV